MKSFSTAKFIFAISIFTGSGVSGSFSPLGHGTALELAGSELDITGFSFPDYFFFNTGEEHGTQLVDMYRFLS